MFNGLNVSPLNAFKGLNASRKLLKRLINIIILFLTSPFWTNKDMGTPWVFICFRLSHAITLDHGNGTPDFSNMILSISLMISYYLLNLFLGICSLQVGFFSRVIHFSLCMSFILTEVLKTFSLASPFIKGSVKFWSVNTWSTITTQVVRNALMVLYLQHICRLFCYNNGSKFAIVAILLTRRRIELLLDL